ncbi:hypothetical protein D9M68_803700 [compost metagenome]
MAIGLGRADHGGQHGGAVLFGFRRGQAVQRLGRRGGGAGLVALPVAVGTVGQGAQRRHAAVHGDLAADLAGLLAAQQQPEGARAERAAAQAGQEGRVFAACGALHAVGGVGQQALPGLQQLIEELSGAHAAPFRCFGYGG